MLNRKSLQVCQKCDISALNLSPLLYVKEKIFWVLSSFMCVYVRCTAP